MATIHIPIEIQADGTYQTLLDNATITMEPLLETNVPRPIDIQENKEVLDILREYLQPLTIQPQEIKKRTGKALNSSFKKYHTNQSVKYYRNKEKILQNRTAKNKYTARVYHDE